MHYPVMRNEVLEMLAIRPDGIYADTTAGLGGHTAAIAERLTTGLALALDRDAESLEMARRNTTQWAERIRYRQSSFSQLRSTLAELGFQTLDGLVADLGASRYQLTDPDRGFTFAAAGPLDMRMDRSQRITAADLANITKERELADLIFHFGEERRARTIARAIVRARPIRDTLHLAGVVERAVPRTGRLHPATLTFQALRRAVNREAEELGALLDAAPGLVRSGGRIVIISFMSLEDRQVKQAFRQLAGEARVRLLTRHVLKPSQEEVDANPASRSARLRAVEII
jgi:16S rRNA (cytosine1402-N4)-methyltransferase